MESYPSSAGAADLADRAFPFIGAYDSGHTDTADRHEEILATGLGGAHERLGPMCGEPVSPTDPDGEACFRPDSDCGPGLHRSLHGTRW